MKNLKIKQDDKKPIPQEVIAGAIIEIAAGMKRISQSRLSRKAIVALIHDTSKVKKSDIETVLNNLESMEITWLRK